MFANHGASVGIIPRDERAITIMATSRKETELNDSLDIELLAILRRHQLYVQMGILHLLVETGSLLNGQSDSTLFCFDGFWK